MNGANGAQYGQPVYSQPAYGQQGYNQQGYSQPQPNGATSAGRPGPPAHTESTEHVGRVYLAAIKLRQRQWPLEHAEPVGQPDA